MRTRLIKFAVSACLAAALVIMPAGVSIAAESSQEPSAADNSQNGSIIKNKEEVIYAALGSDGSVRAVYAVNRFEATRAGQVTDYGGYSVVQNLTDTGPMANHGGAVSFHAGQGNFYYQGDMDNDDLPWNFELSYYLDGVKQKPQELAGRSGDLQIRIATRQNQNINPVFYEYYMLQISITLDTEKCAGIQAPDATIASAGKNTVIAYTVMPKKDADFRLSASVKDFAMSGIQITGMPLSIHMELPDTDDMISDFNKLSDAISDLNDGVGDLADGVADMKTGARELKNGSADIQEGLLELSKNSAQLVGASSQIDSALSQMASALKGALSGEINLDDLARLPQGLAQLAAGLEGISGGLAELKGGFSSAYAALDTAIEDIPDTAITQGEFDALYAATDPGQHGLLDKLAASYSAGQTVKGTYDSVKDAFDAVGPALTTLSGSIDAVAGNLQAMADGIEDAPSGMDILQQLGQLSSGLSELSGNYAGFHKGLCDYMGGIDEMASGYAAFHKGLAAFSGGVGDLYDGVAELHDGTSELKDETAELPDTVQSEIDGMVDEYTGSDFQPVSFTSPRNTNVGLVQFVLKCDGIEKPEETTAAPSEKKNETVWDRLAALFKGRE